MAYQLRWCVQVDGSLQHVSESTQIELTTPPAYTALADPGIFVFAPTRSLHASESFNLALFARADSSSIQGFQTRITYDTAVLNYVGFSQPPLLRCALSALIRACFGVPAEP